MVKTLNRHCPVDINVKIVNTDIDPLYKGYGNGAGWPQGMMKVACMKTMSFADDDWVLSVDSDMVFCNGDVFKHIDPKYGIIGVLGQQPWDTVYGKWAHMSGCLIFLRGDIAREICSWSEQAFDRIRFEQFKPCNMTENEDVMLSYFAMLAKAEQKDISEFHSGNFEGDLIDHDKIIGHSLNGFYHLNYNPTHFLGEPVNGAKWEIPRVLKMKGIEL
jgi:hypothetical protein